MPPLMRYYASLLNKQRSVRLLHFRNLTCWRLGSRKTRKLTATAIERTAMDIHSHRHFFLIFWFLTEDVHRHAVFTAREGLPRKQLFSRTSSIFFLHYSQASNCTTYIGPYFKALNVLFEAGNGAAGRNLLSPVGDWQYGNPINASTGLGKFFVRSLPTTWPCWIDTRGLENEKNSSEDIRDRRLGPWNNEDQKMAISRAEKPISRTCGRSESIAVVQNSTWMIIDKQKTCCNSRKLRTWMFGSGFICPWHSPRIACVGNGPR